MDHCLSDLLEKAVSASMGSLKDYSLKQYLVFAEKLQSKAKVKNLLSLYLLHAFKLFDEMIHRMEQSLSICMDKECRTSELIGVNIVLILINSLFEVLILINC